MNEGARAMQGGATAKESHEEALVRAFEATREQRALEGRTPRGPRDAVYRVHACLNCGALTLDALGGSEPWASWLAWPRVESVLDAADLLDTLAIEPARDGAACACDPRRTARREVIGARWYRAMAGTGLDACVEGRRAPRTRAEPSPWSWRLRAAAPDGPDRVVAEDLDPRALHAALGRPLALVDAWRELLRVAAQGESAMAQMEPGFWIFAGPEDATPWREAVAEVCAGARTRSVLTVDPTVLAHAPWAQRDEEAFKALASGPLHAGMIVDGATLGALVRLGVLRAGASVEPGETNDRVVARLGELRCTVELSTVAAQGLAQMWTLSETAAVTVGEVTSRLHQASSFLQAIAARRPQMRFGVDGFTAWPVHSDESVGRPFGLLRGPGAPTLDADGIEREARYACDPLPRYADPLRVCPCGAGAWLTQRLIPWANLEAIVRAAEGDAPATTTLFRDGTTPLAGLVVAICCDRHVRLLSRTDLLRLGLDETTLRERLALDRVHEVFTFGTKAQVDDAGRTAVLAQGAMLASVLFDDGLLASLHGALGMPLPLDRTVQVVSNAPGVLVLHEPEMAPGLVEDLLSEGAVRDGIALGTTAPFRLARAARLDAAPKGRFVPS